MVLHYIYYVTSSTDVHINKNTRERLSGVGESRERATRREGMLDSDMALGTSVDSKSTDVS